MVNLVTKRRRVKCWRAERRAQSAENSTGLWSSALSPLRSALWSQRRFEDRFPREEGRVAQFFFNAQELVVLGHAVAARGRSGLDLARVRGHGQVGDRGVLGLAGAVRDDGAVAGAFAHLDG